MKRLCLFLWAALLLHACQNAPVKNNKGKLTDTASYAFKGKRLSIWVINPHNQNAATKLSALKAYEHNDTAQLRKYLADSIMVYYDGGLYKGSAKEFMYTLKARAKLYKNLRINIKDQQSVVSRDKQQERVTTWYTQYWINAQGQPDSLDIVNVAQFKNGKITVVYDYMRRYKK